MQSGKRANLLAASERPPDRIWSGLEDLEPRLLLSLTAPVFANPVNLATGVSPSSVIAADLNGDGKMDLAVANQSDNTVSVLLGVGDGTFQTAKTYSVGAGPDSVIAADLNKDGALDLVTANGGDNTVSILLGNGDGTFQTAKTCSVGSGPDSIIAADLNKDGKLDLVTANGGNRTVSVLFGYGNGTFQAAAALTVGPDPTSVIAADINGDGNLDLATADFGDYTVSVVLGNGNGTFQTQRAYSVGGEPYSLTAADLNGDGNQDLVTANCNDNTVSVLLGSGNDSFLIPQTYSVGSCPYSVAAADLNQDGTLDLATANALDNTVSVLAGNGNGTFAAPSTFAVGYAPVSVIAANLIVGDSRVDLVTANTGDNTASVLVNTTTPPDDLQITVTDGQATTTPGASLTYTIAVTNAGPSTATGATVADAFPAGLTGVTFTAVQSGGASGFTAGGSSNISDIVAMPSGSTITYTVAGTVSATVVGTLSDTATVTAPSSVNDTNPANNTATDADVVVPAVTNLSVNDPVVSDADAGTGTFVVTATYNQVMKTTVNPAIGFTPSVAGTLTFYSGGWTDSTHYQAVYSVADAGVKVSSIGIGVTGAQDANGNTQMAYSGSNNFSIDTQNPTATVSVNDPIVTDAAVGTGTFVVTATFSEAMTTTVNPAITLTPSVATTLTFSVGAWTDSTHYQAVYDVADAGVAALNVGIGATAAQDASGNTQIAYSGTNNFKIDTLNPTVTGLSVNDALLTDVDAGTGKFVVTATYNEAMKTTVKPTITFTPSAAGTLTFSSGLWEDSTHYQATYNVADAGVAVENIGIGVTGAQDPNGEVQAAYAGSNNFNIDTLNPAVAGLSVSDTLLTDADVGAGTFVVTATYNQAMKTTVTPAIGFAPAVAGTLTFNSGAWTDSTHYQAVYNVADAGVTVSEVGIGIIGAQDVNSQTQMAYSGTNNFRIDTQSPTVTVNSLTTANTTPTLTGTVTDAGGISAMTVVVGGQTLTATVTGTTWSAAVLTALPVGTYNVTATATDGVGNSTSKTLTNGLLVSFVNLAGALGTTWTLPSSIIAGKSLTGSVSVVVSNLGNVALPSGQTINIQFVAEDTTDTNNPPITLLTLNNESVSALAAKGTKTFTATISRTSGLPADSYQIVANIVPVQSLVESSTSDNTVTVTAAGLTKTITVVLPFVNLTGKFGTTWTLPSSIIGGKSLTGSVSVIVSNLGNVALPSGQTVNIQFVAEDTTDTNNPDITLLTLNNESVSGLAAKGTKTFTATLSRSAGLPADSYQIVANIVPVQALVESSDSDNTATSPAKTIAVAPAVMDLAGKFGTNWTLPSSIVAGKSLTGSVSVVVSNLGNVALPSGQTIDIQFVAEDTTNPNNPAITLLTLSNESVSGLVAKGTKIFSATVSLAAGLPADRYQIVANIVPVQPLAESSTSDNVVTVTAAGLTKSITAS